MTCDVIACFYRQEEYADLFWAGLKPNLKHVENVYLVNDEETWGADFNSHAIAPPGPFWLLQHPHVGHGVSISFNQAMRVSQADYVFLMSFDQILAPDCLSKILDFAHPDYMVIGAVHTISKSTTIHDLPHPPILRKDYLLKRIQGFKESGRQWSYGRNGHTLLHRETALAIGGFDEEFARIGYGLEDFEFAARFAQAKGVNNILWGPSHSYHFGDEEPSRANPDKQEKPAALTKLVHSLVPLYQRQVALYTADYPAPVTHLRIRQGGTASLGSDLFHDCRLPSWLPDNLLEIITSDESDEHLAILRSKLAPDGAITVMNPTRNDKSYEDLGFEYVSEGDRVTLLLEEA